MKNVIKGLFILITAYLLFIMLQFMTIDFGNLESPYSNIVVFLFLSALYSTSVILFYNYFVSHQIERIVIIAMNIFNINFFVQTFILYTFYDTPFLSGIQTFSFNLLYTIRTWSTFTFAEVHDFLQVPVIINALVLIIVGGIIIKNAKRL